MKPGCERIYIGMQTPEKGRLKRAFYSSLTSALYQIIVICCGFITSRLIVQEYGSSWNGVLTTIVRFLSIFTIVEAGINGSTRVALYKSFAENDLGKTGSIIRANDIFYRKVSIVLIGYIGLLSLIIPNIVNADHSKIAIALMVVIIGISNFAENCWGINSKILLMASQSRYIINIVQSITTIISAILLVIIIKLGGSILASKAGGSAVYTIAPIILFVISRRMFHIDRKAVPDDTALKGRWDVMANSISNIVHENVDVFFLTVFCSSAELSVYAMYTVVSNGLTKVFQVIINGIEAGFGNMWTNMEMDLLKSRLRQFEYIMYSLSVLLFGCMMVLIVPFMSVYMRGITDVNYQRLSLGICLALAQILMSIRMPYVLLVQAAGHYKQVKNGAILEMVINIVFTWIFVVRYGIIGAIVGTIIANMFRTIQYGWYASKHMISRPFSNITYRMVWSAAVLLLSCLISFQAIHYIDVANWVMWFVSAGIVFIIQLCILAIFSLLFYKKDLQDCLHLIILATKR